MDDAWDLVEEEEVRQISGDRTGWIEEAIHYVHRFGEAIPGSIEGFSICPDRLFADTYVLGIHHFL